MALTELQRPEKQRFYSQIQADAKQFDNLIAKWRSQAEFLERMDAATMADMGISDATVIIDLANYCIALNEIVAFYDGTGLTQTNIPADVMDRIRLM